MTNQSGRAFPGSAGGSLAEKYLTASQLASLLHVKERKVYELAASGDLPATRALGKWLFEREAVFHWLQQHGPSPAHSGHLSAPPLMALGSHDPLLDWALRESGCGLGTLFDGSQDGLDRLARHEGVLAGVHIIDALTGRWNVPAIAAAFPHEPVVLAEWAWRERGIMVATGNPQGVRSIADLNGLRFAPRQDGSGSQVLLAQQLSEAGMGADAMTMTVPARTEVDAALAVVEGQADAAFGLQAIAAQFRLDFIPVIRERFDLLVWRREWFEPPVQQLLEFTRSPRFRERAEQLSGYDISGLGTIHYNAS